MNLTAVLDAAAQRSTTPLDRPVSDSSDSGFANVMSQVRKSGDEKPADSSAAAQKPGQTQTSRAADDGNETPATNTAATDSAQPAQNAEPDANQNASPQEDPVEADGEPLPVVAAAAGQTLPPLSEIVVDPTEAFAGEPAHPKAEDGSVDGDPSAALLFAAFAPPPPAPQAPASAALPALGSGGVDQSAAAAPKPTDVSAAAAQSAADVADPAQLQAELDRLRDATAGKQIDPRAQNTAPSQAALAQAAAQAAAQRNAADQTSAAPSIAQTLRSFARPQQPGTDSGNTTGQRRDPRIRPADAAGASGAAKTPIAQLASLLEGAAQKDAATPHHDSADASIRTDAVTQRANGTPEAPRDTAAVRLNDLAQLHAQRFAGELADRVLVLRSQRLDTATVTLEPRDLGRIDIQVRLQADTTHVAFTAQHAAVRDALEGQMPRLRAMLEDAGLSLGGVNVSSSGGQSGTDAGAARSFEPQKSASVASVGDSVAGSTPWQRRVENALIDLHA